MSKLMVIPNKKEDINIILNKDIEGTRSKRFIYI